MVASAGKSPGRVLSQLGQSGLPETAIRVPIVVLSDAALTMPAPVNTLNQHWISENNLDFA